MTFEKGDLVVWSNPDNPNDRRNGSPGVIFGFVLENGGNPIWAVSFKKFGNMTDLTELYVYEKCLSHAEMKYTPSQEGDKADDI